METTGIQPEDQEGPVFANPIPIATVPDRRSPALTVGPGFRRHSCSQSTLRRKETYGRALVRGPETRAQHEGITSRS